MRNTISLFASKARRLARSVADLANDRKGVTAVEYGVIGALIIVGSVVVIGEAGANLATIFGEIRDALVLE